MKSKLGKDHHATFNHLLVTRTLTNLKNSLNSVGFGLNFRGVNHWGWDVQAALEEEVKHGEQDG